MASSGAQDRALSLLEDDAVHAAKLIHDLTVGADARCSPRHANWYDVAGSSNQTEFFHVRSMVSPINDAGRCPAPMPVHGAAPL